MARPPRAPLIGRRLHVAFDVAVNARRRRGRRVPSRGSRSRAADDGMGPVVEAATSRREPAAAVSSRGVVLGLAAAGWEPVAVVRR